MNLYSMKAGDWSQRYPEHKQRLQRMAYAAAWHMKQDALSLL